MAKLDSTTIYGNLTVIGDIISGGNLKGKQLTLTCTATTAIDLNLSDNFYVLLNQNTTFTLSNISTNIGKAGTIVLLQDGTGGRSFTKATEMKTPLHGATIVQVTTLNTLSILTYYVVSATIVIVNYIGDFA